MNRLNKTNLRQDRVQVANNIATFLGAGAVLTAALVSTSAAHAQSSASRSASGSVSIVEVTAATQTGSARRGSTSSANIPASARAVMARAATMLQAAQARQGNSFGGARQSYQAATTALRQALAEGRYSTTTTGTSSSFAGLPVTSTQIAADIRTLKGAMRGASPSQSAALQRVASLYATGAKEFFTGQLREALFSSGDNSSSTIAVRGYSSPSGNATYGTSSSAVLGKTVVPRGVQRGGVIQPDGSVAPFGTAPQIPDTTGATPPTPANTVGTNAVDAPPLGISPTVLGGGTVLPVNPVAPIGGTVIVPTAPVTTPTTPTTPSNPNNPNGPTPTP